MSSGKRRPFCLGLNVLIEVRNCIHTWLFWLRYYRISLYQTGVGLYKIITARSFPPCWFHFIIWKPLCTRVNVSYIFAPIIASAFVPFFLKTTPFAKSTPHNTYRTRAPATKPGSSWQKVYIKSSHSPFESQIYSNSMARVVLCQGVWYYDHMTCNSCRKS